MKFIYFSFAVLFFTTVNANQTVLKLNSEMISNLSNEIVLKSNNQSQTEDFFFTRKRLQGTIKLSGGCIIKYDITVEYTIIPPSFELVSGKVTFSGGPCSGTQTFGATGKFDGKQLSDLVIDSRDPLLNSGEFASKLTNDINANGF